MTLSDNTPPAQHETLAFEFELEHSPEKVWRALTDPTLLREWLLPVADHGLEPDVTFTFQAPPQAGWDGKVKCRMLESEPHKKLSYTWAAFGDIDTVVTFTLTPTASGTRLGLVHSGFKPHHKGAFAGQRYGWKLMGEKLVELLGRTS